MVHLRRAGTDLHRPINLAWQQAGHFFREAAWRHSRAKREVLILLSDCHIDHRQHRAHLADQSDLLADEEVRKLLVVRSI